MDVWDNLWSLLVPWPANSTGMVPTIVVYSIAVAVGWTLAWLLAWFVLQNDDLDYWDVCRLLDEANERLELLTDLQGTGQVPE